MNPLNRAHKPAKPKRQPVRSGSDRILCAAATMDWQQVVMNGGPPCFHLEPNGIKFCGRAERWAGHDGKSHHEFVSLRELIETVERLQSQSTEPQS